MNSKVAKSGNGAQLVAKGFRLPEGACWRDGRLYVSDLYGGWVVTVLPDGSVSQLCQVPNGPSGLGFTPDGDLLVVSMRDRRLLRLHKGTLEQYADLSKLIDFPLNDMLVDGAGVAWIGNYGIDFPDPGSIDGTSLLQVDAEGTVSVVGSDLIFPNGLARTPSDTLLVAETYGYRVSAFDIEADGSLANRRTWAQFRDSPAHNSAEMNSINSFAPDGMCLDAAGGLWVADSNGYGLHRLLPGGEQTETIELDGLTPYSAAFGGEDGRSLYLCAAPPWREGRLMTERAGSIWVTEVEIPGIAWA
jgi:sugar lactone lactonase YvrE